MNYNTRNRSNDTKENKKEKRPALMLIFRTVSQKSRITKVYILRLRCGH